MIHVYDFLSKIKVKRLNWRGLWATKQIEGTVDDDVAAKLAIGEGKQVCVCVCMYVCMFVYVYCNAYRFLLLYNI